MTEADFITATYPGAMAAQKKYGLPALAIMAQSAQETGWGASTPGNMFFGIKAGASWTGKTQLLWTHENVNGTSVRVQAKFRAYDNPEQSFDDYSHFISSNERYSDALQFTNDPESYIQAVADAGYATDPNYADEIMSKIDDIKKKLKK